MPGNASSWFNAEIVLRAAASGWKRRRTPGPVDIFLCVVDHFEPQVGQPAGYVARERLEEWLGLYPAMAGQFRDWEGRHPAHGFFYPWDEFDAWEFERLSELCADGWGEIDLHLHHRDDREASLRRKLSQASSAYAPALSRWPDGRPAWGFIHGNWALANSRHDCDRNYCGVDHELALLDEAGCFADFTFPAWRYTSQPRRVNTLYYADPWAGRKGYERGVEAASGRRGEGLLLVQGPLIPQLVRRSGRPRLAVDDGDLAASRRYRPERLDRWVRQGISVAGRPDQVYIKLHCHGAADENRRLLLEQGLPALYTDAEARYNDGERFRLHYVTAREMFNLVRAAETGRRIPVEEARDWVLPRPFAFRPLALLPLVTA